MIIKKYNYLPEEASQIRIDVFVEEQGFCHEFDAVDDIAVHLVMFDESLPVAVCRYYWNEDKNSYAVGRIAVRKEYRGKEMGAKILSEAERQIKETGGQEVYLSAQVRAAGFYKKQGYSVSGEEYGDEHCPHVWMRKRLES